MREPDLKGIARAWRVKLTPEAKKAHIDSFGWEDTTLANWIINGPYHPLWSWWMIGLIGLENVEGAPPVHKQYPEAKYEIMCLSLNPDGEPDIDLLEAGDITKGMPGFLTPPDWVVQFHDVTDEQAIRIAELVVDRIVKGQSCDSDFRQWWINSIKNTVDHYRAGIHE